MYCFSHPLPGDDTLDEHDWKPASIPVFAGVTPERFRTEILPLDEPAVLEGLVADWPLVEKARQSDEAVLEYVGSFGRETGVKAFFGDASIEGRFFYSDDIRGFNFERRELSLGKLIDDLRSLRDEKSPDYIYAGAIPLRDTLASLLKQNHLDSFELADEQLVSLWMGNRTRTAPHWDLPQNVACVVAGRRRFLLFPPEQLENLYMGPLDTTLAGQPVSLVDVARPDFERFPKFRRAMAAAQAAELGPGDAMFIPSMWFHQVESLDPIGMLVNFWWRDAGPHMFTPLFTMLHALLSIRDMPPVERAHWQRMFDHYIFNADDETMAHIPGDARGFFGELTPQKINRLRAYLLHSLGGEPRR